MGNHSQSNIVKTRFAYQIIIPRIVIYVIAIILFILFGLIVLFQPLFFSPYTPLYKHIRDVQFENNFIDEYRIVFMKEMYFYKTYYTSKVENVSFIDEKIDRRCYGLLEFCQQQSNDQEKSKMYVDSCVYLVHGREKILTYEKLNEKNVFHNRTLFLKSELDQMFQTKMIFVAIFFGVVFIIMLILNVVTFISEDTYGKKRYTLIKNSQMPLLSQVSEISLEEVDIGVEEREPFIVSEANVEKFGKIVLSVGTLISPKFTENESVLDKYNLQCSSNVDKNTLNIGGKKDGFWKVMATSAKSEDEKIIECITQRELFKLKPSKFIWNALIDISKNTVVYLSAIFLMVILSIFFYTAFLRSKYFEYYVSLIILIFLYVIMFIYDLFSTIQRCKSGIVLLTNKRLIYMWKTYFRCRINYLFYSDIENVYLSDPSKLIKINIKHDLLLLLNPSVKWSKISEKVKELIAKKSIPFIFRLESFWRDNEKRYFIKRIRELLEKDQRSQENSHSINNERVFTSKLAKSLSITTTDLSSDDDDDDYVKKDEKESIEFHNNDVIEEIDVDPTHEYNITVKSRNVFNY